MRTVTGWSPTGVDVSDDMLRLARARGLDVVQADATALPFPDDSFDAAVSLWTHTDVGDFAGYVTALERHGQDRARGLIREVRRG